MHIKEGNINYFDTIIIIDFQREVNEEDKTTLDLGGDFHLLFIYFHFFFFEN